MCEREREHVMCMRVVVWYEGFGSLCVYARRARARVCAYVCERVTMCVRACVCVQSPELCVFRFV